MTTAHNPSSLSNEELDALIDTTWNDTTMITAMCTTANTFLLDDLIYLARELNKASEIPDDGWVTVTVGDDAIQVIPMMDNPDNPEVRAFLLKLRGEYAIAPAHLIADDATRTLIDTHLRATRQKD